MTYKPAAAILAFLIAVALFSFATNSDISDRKMTVLLITLLLHIVLCVFIFTNDLIP